MVFIAVAIDCVILGFLVRRKLAAKFGGMDRVERGVRWYAAMRAIQLRVIRLPKPQVKRQFQFPNVRVGATLLICRAQNGPR